MTEQQIESISPAEIEMESCELQILYNVAEIETLDEALGAFALDLIRYGLDALYILATDPSGKQWVVHGDEVMEPAQARERLQKAQSEARERLNQMLSDDEGDDEAASDAADSLEG